MSLVNKNQGYISTIVSRCCVGGLYVMYEYEEDEREELHSGNFAI